MNRPQMYHPHGNIINIFSKQFEQLLEEGYSIEQLLHVSRSQMPILATSPHIPLSGIPDIDLIILSQLHIDDIKNIRTLNKYTRELLQRRDFWLPKLANTQLFISSLDTIVNISWVKVYEITSFVNKKMTSLIKHNGIQACVHYEFKSIITMLENAKLKVHETVKKQTADIITEIRIDVGEVKDYKIAFISYNNSSFAVKMTKQYLYNFLFFVTYYG
jgi:hypothetical protein